MSEATVPIVNVPDTTKRRYWLSRLGGPGRHFPTGPSWSHVSEHKEWSLAAQAMTDLAAKDNPPQIYKIEEVYDFTL